MIERLIQIGFNENEAKVYLAVIALGKPRIAQIVSNAKVSKKLCYKALGVLIAQGLVATEGRRKKVFFVTDVELIGERLRERLKVFAHVLPQLYATANEYYTLRSIGTYSDPESIRNLFKQQMRRQKRRSDFLVIESAEFHFIEFMNEGRGGATFDIYERIRLNREVRLKVLFIDAERTIWNEKNKKHFRSKRELRVLPVSVGNTLTGLYIWSDRVFLLTRHGSAVLLVELLNKDIRQGFVAYFESLWNGANVV